MVVHELPKLETRVRFPYPAPTFAQRQLFAKEWKGVRSFYSVLRCVYGWQAGLVVLACIYHSIAIYGTIMGMHTHISLPRPLVRLLSIGAFSLSAAAGTFSLALQVSAQSAGFTPPTDLILLEPIGTPSFPPSAGINILFDYFNDVWPWVLGSAAGIAVLWTLIGGIQIMLSGDNTTMRGEGKERLMWALAGLLIIALAGVILTTLNPVFYRQVP